MRILRIPFSTNVERVALAFGHKGVPVSWFDVDAADRTQVRELSGQDLVPVMETDHGEIVVDSMRIIAWLENHRPAPPLWPADPTRRAEVDVFIEWFNRVWKAPPNAMADELASATPDRRALDAHAEELRGWLHGFEALLDQRRYLMGDAFGVADVCAFPFLKYGVLHDPQDDELFHRVLMDHLPIRGAFPRLEAWIHRVDEHPRA